MASFLLSYCCTDSPDEANQIVNSEQLSMPVLPVVIARSDSPSPPSKQSGATVTREVSLASEAPQSARGMPGRRQFMITLDNYDPSQLGVELDLTDAERPLISEVLPGLVQQWNERHPADALRVYDRICAVGGRGGNDIYQRLCAQQPSIRLTIDRPEIITITLFKPGDLGLNLHFKKSSHALVVKDIFDGGLFAKWNANNPEQPVAIGDRIFAFGGQVEKGRSLVNKLKEAKNKVELSVAHY
eukprot:TRINITY_DN69752_c0_g1_i1.p1 TRINITY_DN69752_c0_g1~~TRINITY_DN69752_c0_g1_i1.p1  ORF type:complete len:243 (-),score=36.31 TRINITY_DN69752_c0_g1_i1:81-809(-)